MNIHSFKFFHALTAGAFLASLAGLSSVCHADEPLTPPQVVVKFSDLDLSTSRGVQVLYRRIDSAAGDVCLRMYVSDESYRVHRNACLQKVTADAVAKVNSPALTEVFASRYKHSAPLVVASAKAR